MENKSLRSQLLTATMRAEEAEKALGEMDNSVAFYRGAVWMSQDAYETLKSDISELKAELGEANSENQYMGQLWKDMAIDLGAADTALEMRQTYISELEATNEKLRALLRKVEWFFRPPNYEGQLWFCPICRNARPSGHTPGCELAQALGDNK